MRIAGPQILLLDLDNTVYAYSPCHRAGIEAAQTVARKLDGEWGQKRVFENDYQRARAAVKAQIGNQAAAHSRLLYFKRMQEQREGRSSLTSSRDLQAAYWRGYFSVMKRDEGCAETLESMRLRGVRTAWVTSFTTARQIQKLETLGLETAADLLLTTEEVGFEKPDGRLVDIALRRLGGKTGETWVIGDSLVADQRMAVARQLPFVWFRRADDTAQPEQPPLHTVGSWLELREILHDAR